MYRSNRTSLSHRHRPAFSYPCKYSCTYAPIYGSAATFTRSSAVLLSLSPFLPAAAHPPCRCRRHRRLVRRLPKGKTAPLHVTLCPTTYIILGLFANVVILSKKKFKSFIVDDGSATAKCLIWDNSNNTSYSPTQAAQEEFKLGDFVEVRGAIQWRQKKPVIVVDYAKRDNDPHAELLWWVHLHRSYTHVYTKPFPIAEHLPSSQVTTK